MAFLPIKGATFGWRKPVSDQPGVVTPERAITATTVLGARSAVPIHYGISGVDDYQKVDDPLDALIKVARRSAIEVKSVHPGVWVAGR